MRRKLAPGAALLSSAARALVPACALGAAALLLAPTQESFGFSVLGTNLNVGSERDWRVFDNFADAATNNNVTPDALFPGWLGAEMALWKAATEWASRPHGGGGGDPTQTTLGDGAANFDFFFGGACTGPGNGAQVVSTIPSCGGGTFAYVSGGGNSWTMIVCDNWNWSDGPGSPSGGQIDLQGVGCHEFGHSLGLGHSSVSGATMVGSTTNGFSQRSIAADDIAGVQSIYGVADPAKPIISSVSVDLPGNSLTIQGSSFSATGNDVWFASSFATAGNTDPRVIVSGVDSSAGGTLITVSLPASAGDGDVHVRSTLAGGAGLSNGWPVDLDGASGPTIDITGITPGTVDSLIPGPDQTVTINGTGFSASTTVTIDDVLMDPADYTFVNSTTITLDMPQVSALGAIAVRVDDGALNDTASIDVVAQTAPLLQIGNGLIAVENQISSASGLPVIFAGPPGEFHFVLGSTSNVPSSIPIVSLCLGNNFQDLFETASGVVGAAGYNELLLPLAPTFNLFFFQSVTFSQGKPLPASNCQEALILF